MLGSGERRSWRVRLGCWSTAIGLLAGLALTVPTSASAAVPAVRQRGVANATADALPTAQIDGVVLAQVVVGSTVYAAGEFRNARPAGAAPGTQQVRRWNLLAYDIRTGVLTGFAPEVNGRIKAIAASADEKTIYIGGTFTRVGTAVRNRFAAFSVATGGLRRLKPSVNGTVNAITVAGSRVYLGGSFTKVNSSTRSRLAAVSSGTGSLTSWAPVADATVQALTATPDQTKIIAGGHFYTINGTRAYGLAAMKASTGARKTWLVNRVVRNWGPKSAILSLTSDANTVYGSGYAYQGGNFEGVFAASPADGAIRWLQDCHGDTYSVAPVGDVVYSANHAHYCSNIGGFPDTSPRVHHHALAVTKAATGTVATNGQPGAHYGNFGGQPAPALFNWFPDFTPGSYTGLSQATWSVAGGRGYVVYGGEFTRVNGVAQQGLVRFAVPSLAPRESGPMDRRPLSAPWVTANRAGGADVTWPANWDRDDLTLSYLLRRDQTELATLSASAPFWKRPLLTRTDAGPSAGPTYRYEVTATDPDGNAWTSASTEFRTSGYASEVRADGATHQWRLDSRPGSSADRDQAGASALNLSRQIALGTRGALRPETSTGATLSGSAAVAGRSVESESPSPRTTLEVWFRTTTAGGTLVAFGSGDAGRPTTRSHELYLTPTGRLSFAVRGSGATGADAVFAATTGPVTDGAWHHAAAVQATGELRLYLDGSLAATKSGTVPVGSAGRWWVGGATPTDLVNAAKTAYAGDLDEVAVYPAALSGPALADHVAIGRG